MFDDPEPAHGRAPLVVHKYGGSSLASVEALRSVARRLVETKRRGLRVVVVASAMGDSTDDLLGLARRICRDPDGRELDLLLATAEQVSATLLALAIQEEGEAAVALTGPQAGIETNDVHGNGRIVAVHPQRVLAEVERGRIVVVAGFQGASEQGEVTTLGRGGSDTSATALAAALSADSCDIYTDVAGVFSADPRVVPQARLLERLSSDELQELAWHGAQVMKAEAVELARSNHVSLTVRSARMEGGGTTIVPDGAGASFRPRRAEVAGVSGRTDLLRIDFADGLSPELRSSVFREVARYDLVCGRLGEGAGRIYLSTLEMPDADRVAARLAAQLGTGQVRGLLGAASLVGFGIGSRPHSLLDAVDRLEAESIRVLDTFTGRESVTMVVEARRVEEAVETLHRQLVAPVQSAPPQYSAGVA